jgi:hypothetical protein
MARRALWILGSLFGFGFAVAGVVWATWPESPPPVDWSREYDSTPRPIETVRFVSADPATYDLTSKPAESLEPGTVVEKTAPEGWSHLIIKSLPRVREDQKEGLPALTVEKAAWMFTAFVANVKKDDRGRYAFDKAALGLGAKAKSADTILTAGTGRKLGGDLGLFGSEILNKGYEVQKKAVLVFSGPSMALLDTPVWFRVGDDNKLVRYRYAMLVDAATGRVDTILWRLGTDGVGTNFDDAVWLKPDTIDIAELVVDRRKVNRFGVPADDAFAVDKMPAGSRIAIPAEIQKLAAQTRFTADDAFALESALRAIPKPKP